MITEPELLEAATNILVTNDLLDEVIRDADSHTIDQAIVMRATIAEVIAKAKEAIAALDVHLTSEMELYEPVNFKGVEYKVVRKRDKVRFDHGMIAGRVQSIALAHPVESSTTPREMVMQAVSLMRRIYLSDSTGAKVTELKRLGIDVEDVRSVEYGDKEIRVTPLQSGDQEARNEA